MTVRGTTARAARLDLVALVVAAGALAALGADLVLDGALTGRPSGGADAAAWGHLAVAALAVLAVVVVRTAVVLRRRRVAEDAVLGGRADPLTGLPTRAVLVEDLLDGADGTPTGYRLLAVLDLGGLGRVNRTRGHDTGDDVLAHAARTAVEALGGHGRVYRLGGDEFCLLVRSDGTRARAAVASAALAVEEAVRPWGVRCATGVVEVAGASPDLVGLVAVATRRMAGQAAE